MFFDVDSSKIHNLAELVYYSYANLQMLNVAMSQGKEKYDRLCYMVRSKAFRSYKEGLWQMHDLFENNIAKMKNGNRCWYCGEEIPKTQLTIDHVIPRKKGGGNEMDNVILVCKHCNFSKQDTDLFEWFFCCRKQFPPVHILQHYLKQIYQFAKDNDLLMVQLKKLEFMSLPFNFKFIPTKYPQPKYFLDLEKKQGYRV